jgi:hypothetical protein
MDKHGHDSLGPIDPNLLPHAIGQMGFPVSGPLFMDDGFDNAASNAFLDDDHGLSERPFTEGETFIPKSEPYVASVVALTPV